VGRGWEGIEYPVKSSESGGGGEGAERVVVPLTASDIVIDLI
jgi:hypothetical protein